jgi:LytR cell envelope-related transcriptional attenuator
VAEQPVAEQPVAEPSVAGSGGPLVESPVAEPLVEPSVAGSGGPLVESPVAEPLVEPSVAVESAVVLPEAALGPAAPVPTPLRPGRPGRYVPRIERPVGARSLLVLVASIAILAAALVLLAWVVYDRVASAPDTVADTPGAPPPAPVEPRPRTLVVHTDGESLVGITIAALDGSGQGGSLVFVPPGTMLEVPGATLQRLDQAASEGGPEAVRLALENLIGVPFAAMSVVTPQDWPELLAEQSILTVENPAALVRVLADGSSELVHPAGPIDLAPTEIPALLAGQSPGEDTLDRLVRHQRVWESVLAAKRPPVPGDGGSPAEGDDLAGLVGALAAGEVDYRILPVGLIDPAAELYALDETEAASVLDAIAPERHGGAEADRVQLLNGVGTPGLAGAVASILVPEGLSVPLTDNAERFGYATTQIVYYRPEASATAAQVRELLGVGEVVRSRSVLDAVDVTVVIGEDLADTLAVDAAAAVDPVPVEGEVAGA